ARRRRAATRPLDDPFRARPSRRSRRSLASLDRYAAGPSCPLEPALGEDLADERFEVLERQRVVVGVEGDLVPLVGEALGKCPRFGIELGAVLLARARVAAEMGVVVASLKVLVHTDHVVD